MMKIKIVIFFAIIGLVNCKDEIRNDKMKFLVKEIPEKVPIEFKGDLIPNNKIIHKGIFNPNFEEYYYTVSDKNFEKFDVWVVEKEGNDWSIPKTAFFNTAYNEHGMSFSPDGNSLFFSSTRPVNDERVSDTWHIWTSNKVEEKWSYPVFVDIPNLRDKLVSHPTVTNSGTIYFHVSNLDYSEMDIYSSKPVASGFSNAEKSNIIMDFKIGKCTPFVSPNEEYLIFAAIGEQLDLIVGFNDGKGNWTNTKKLNNLINNQGQGNPYVTPDNQYLFFTTGSHSDKNWKIKWTSIKGELEK